MKKIRMLIARLRGVLEARGLSRDQGRERFLVYFRNAVATAIRGGCGPEMYRIVRELTKEGTV